jgi:site-specific DNA-methyltransferase (adenine-specific)
MIHTSLYSSQKEDWATPQEFFDRLNHVFHFELDVCASPENTKCSQYFTKEQDALTRSWNTARSIWMKKAYMESLKGCIVVCLVHARTDTRWWHDWVKNKGVVIFVKGRLKFGDSKNSAPFPSAVVVYGLDLEHVINGSCSELCC